LCDAQRRRDGDADDAKDANRISHMRERERGREGEREREGESTAPISHAYADEPGTGSSLFYGPRKEKKEALHYYVCAVNNDGGGRCERHMDVVIQ